MIHDVINILAGELNRFLQSKHNIMEEKVVLSSLVNSDGTIAIQETDKIILTLANIEVDKTQSNTASYKQSSRGTFSKVMPPVNVNISILFSAYFTSENYLEGLKFISSTIAFFQSRSGIFDAQNTPALAGVISGLNAELISLDYRDASNLWGLLGAKYLPSVMYKIKTLPIKHELPTPDISVIRGT
ncbi:MAG: DUF4255 domain-containing protein [Aureispira sp.]|nr:DUF4255 domain-containing protein [Aureispira sp.]